MKRQRIKRLWLVNGELITWDQIMRDNVAVWHPDSEFPKYWWQGWAKAWVAESSLMGCRPSAQLGFGVCK